MLEKKRSDFCKRSQKGGDNEKKKDVSSHLSFIAVSAFMRYNAANNNQGRA
jgi:hypothetical protein